MNSLFRYCEQIQLHVENRGLSIEDTTRQQRTAQEILNRFDEQPGLILADEVGMGKTFVALAVGVSVALSNRGKHPVVVMIPSTLKQKWPNDFEFFRQHCLHGLPPQLRQTVRCGLAESAVDFLKMLDDPPSRRNSIVFLTHGAMSRGLNDSWVLLAIIRQAMYRRKNSDLRKALFRFVGDLVQKKSLQRKDEGIWEQLLSSDPGEWRAIAGEIEELEDDPVPEAMQRVLPDLDTDAIYRALDAVPRRQSANFGDRIVDARRAVNEQARILWRESLSRLSIKLPLLILDEAHHLKNEDTRLARLFRTADSRMDADEIASKGSLAGVFRRMLFLTATPFQLGHAELCSVLDRFDGVLWGTASAPTCGPELFAQQRIELRTALDEAQESAVTLDQSWGRLRPEDLIVDDLAYAIVDSWWPAVNAIGVRATPLASDVLSAFSRAREHLRKAEQLLKPWVIRHLKSRQLPNCPTDRRQRLPGKCISLGSDNGDHSGLAVPERSLLPLLLAARTTALSPESRPVFAEGLASSYEAFRHTRDRDRTESFLDSDDDLTTVAEPSGDLNWYLEQLDRALSRDDMSEHPKIDATVRRAVDLWSRGEKVVVFCHYVRTGRVLRDRISTAIRNEILSLGARKCGCPREEVDDRLERLGNRITDKDSPIHRAIDEQIGAMIDIEPFKNLGPHRDELLSTIRRNLRTPAFLARFFPLHLEGRDEEALNIALGSDDSSEFRTLLNNFLRFLSQRCQSENERQRYIEAVQKIQIGAHFGQPVSETDEPDEAEQCRTGLLPNVRLVNGQTRSETRQRIMLVFNTPFSPEVLVTSNVLAEGVDLHLNCRHMIHHDLCWNPSTLEQRIGRVDRMGALAETMKQSIQVYVPYIGGTQDEKMYRVVSDRERWFNIVMGEDYRVDAHTTDRLAERIPLPADAARELAFRLSLDS